MPGVSPGATGSSMGQHHLMNILADLDVPTPGRPEAFIQSKEGLFEIARDIGPDHRPFLRTWMERSVAWVRRHADESRAAAAHSTSR